MSIGSRDYVGSSSYLTSVRGPRAEGDGSASSGSGPSGGTSSEIVLETVEQLGPVTPERLADSLGVAVQDVMPHLAKLQDLRLVSSEGQDEDISYVLSEDGRLAREFAKMVPSST